MAKQFPNRDRLGMWAHLYIEMNGESGRPSLRLLSRGCSVESVDATLIGSTAIDSLALATAAGKNGLGHLRNTRQSHM